MHRLGKFSFQTQKQPFWQWQRSAETFPQSPCLEAALSHGEEGGFGSPAHAELDSGATWSKNLAAAGTACARKHLTEPPWARRAAESPGRQCQGQTGHLGSPGTPTGAHPAATSSSTGTARSLAQVRAARAAPASLDTFPWGCASHLMCLLRGKKCVIYGTFKINAHLVFLLIPNYPPHECCSGELCSALSGQWCLRGC